MTKSPAQIGEELDAWLVSRSLTEAELSRALGLASPAVHVSQSWISRIRSGRFTRLSRKTKAVLDYASIRVSSFPAARSSEGERLLNDALDEAWDGSLATAKVLASLLRSAARLSRGR